MQKTLFTHATLSTMRSTRASSTLVENGAIAIANGQIQWCGIEKDIPIRFRDFPQRDLGGRLVTPAPIDCHTHIVYGGNRAHEFAMRLHGASYEAIARSGGGILSTVNATRTATENSLLVDALVRVDALIAEGVCALEIKSGYGLDIDTELKMLRVARSIAVERPIRVRTSFLGAHALPLNYAGKADRYLREQCLPALEAAHAEGLVDAVDGFCEHIGFTPAQIECVFQKAANLGLPVKLHAEQLSDLGAAKLASRYGALSVDHLEYLDSEGVTALAESGTVAVVLPGAYYTLRQTHPPPIAALRDACVPIAVATDCNPGSSPLNSILLAMNMACTIFQLTPEEALAGVTLHAAKALGVEDAGMLLPGLRADLAIWNAQEPADLCYRIGFNPLYERVFGGEE